MATTARAKYKDRHIDPLMVAVFSYRRRVAERLMAAGVGVSVIADAFGVSRQTIYSLLNDDRWALPPATPATAAGGDGDVAAAAADVVGELLTMQPPDDAATSSQATTSDNHQQPRELATTSPTTREWQHDK